MNQSPALVIYPLKTVLRQILDVGIAVISVQEIKGFTPDRAAHIFVIHQDS
ncbi:MAG TPA: hypothetical protein PKA76_13870 [Pirellulaceae bacterium]|nr:hypothetical protein [Pirellulaceae bacterium]